MAAVEVVDLSEIRADVAAQPRAAMLTDKVAEYADRMKEGDEFAAPILFYDGVVYWLADGFHRVAAAKSVGIEKLACLVKEGGLREAILYSCGANAKHGIQRTNEDKRRAVLKMLQDSEWSQKSTREIAKHCHVHHDTVASIKKELKPILSDSDSMKPAATTFTHPKTGKPTTMNTANIGKTKPAAAAPAPAPKAPAAPEESPHDRDLKALMRAWDQACESAREVFRNFVASEPGRKAA